MLKLIKRMLPVLVCAVIFVMSGALGAECSAEEDYGYFGALEDHQDALSGEQAQELLDLLDSTAREIHANVGVILGNASLDGLSERSYAKEFHNRSFGEYSDSIVLMLVQAGSGKVDQIYCTDRAYDMYQPRIAYSTRYTTVWTAPAATTTTRRSRTTARTCGRTIPSRRRWTSTSGTSAA